MPYAKKQRYRGRNAARQPYKSKRRLPMTQMVRQMRNVASNVVMSQIETKRSTALQANNVLINHNSFKELNDNLVRTSPGVDDGQGSASANRIGDRITVKGVSMKFMVEMQPYISDITCRLIVVKCARGDNPATSDNLFIGESNNKMVDLLNRDRYTILKNQTFKLKASNTAYLGSSNALSIGGYNSGSTLVRTDQNLDNGAGAFLPATVQSRTTRLVTCWLPGHHFGPGGVLEYENGTVLAKFFDYRAFLYVYGNSQNDETTRPTGGAVIASVDDCITRMYFKDA